VTATQAHLTALHTQLTDMGIKDRDEKLGTISAILGREVTTTKTLTTGEVNAVVRELAERRTVIV
jgi:hypothetical protein